MECILVSHTHWDREWYRTFQEFRARLVDTIDRVLDLVRADPEFHFLLDGQAIVLEDYVEIRPSRRGELEEAVRSGRIAIGPWYVQPDSILPSGEAHVRNLLEGRRAGEAFGPVSRVAYTPDSFGHPAQFPQLLAGFGLGPFVYWRGNGDEIDELPAEYLWEASDGTSILAHHLSKGYFSASLLPEPPDAAALVLLTIATELAQRTRNDRVLLMNGIDHAGPDPNATAALAALRKVTRWTIKHGLLEDFARDLPQDAPRYRGDLLGGRVANLLPGVWSTRTPLKQANRAVETMLEGWAEPWCALGRVIGLPSEQPALRAAWRSLLQNQAHDSICGCSRDRVHEQMWARYDAAAELGRETARRVLERLAGATPERHTSWSDEVDVAVFNPSPHMRTDVVRFPLDPYPLFEIRSGQNMAVHPLLLSNATAQGFEADGNPVRVAAEHDSSRMHLTPDHPPKTIELVAENVPAFGWRRVRIRPSEAHPEREDEGGEIATDGIRVEAQKDGTFRLEIGDAVYTGLCGVEDIGDCGDTYDFDPVAGGEPVLESVAVRRRVHGSGIQHLRARRTFRIPIALAADRKRRSADTTSIALEIEARLAPQVRRVDLRARLDNTARDHRLRLLFPTGKAISNFRAATTFDVASRQPGRPESKNWVHPAPFTFPQQGFVSANGLTIAAPDLPEAEVTADGTIALTLLRAVGWLSRMDLKTRPQMAGPAIPTPGAQCQGPFETRIALFPGIDVGAVRDAELGLWAVAAGEHPLVGEGHPLVEVDPPEVVLSALKPCERGAGFVLRVLNPTDRAEEVRARFGFPVRSVQALRLDETPLHLPVSLHGNEVAFAVPPHALRSVLVES